MLRRRRAGYPRWPRGAAPRPAEELRDDQSQARLACRQVRRHLRAAVRHLARHRNAGWEVLPATIPEDVAARVSRFMREFLLPHAIAFYAGTLGLADDHDLLAGVAGYILAKRLKVVTGRDVQRGIRSMRGLERRDVQRILQQLEALGGSARGRAPRDRPATLGGQSEVSSRFRGTARFEVESRARTRAVIAKALRGARNG